MPSASREGLKTYDQVADENLQDLCTEARPTREDLLQDANEDMTERRANEHAVQRHFRDARTEVMAVLADIVGEPRGQQFLQAGEHAGSEHLRAQRVFLQLAQVGLR